MYKAHSFGETSQFFQDSGMQVLTYVLLQDNASPVLRTFPRLLERSKVNDLRLYSINVARSISIESLSSMTTFSSNGTLPMSDLGSELGSSRLLDEASVK